MNTFLKLAAVALVGTVAMAAPSSATVVNGVCGNVSGLTELGGSTPGTFSCTAFDANLGPLTSMVLTITGSIETTISLTNTNLDTQGGSATTISQFNVGALTGFTVTNPIFTLNASTGPVSLAAGASTVVGPVLASGNSGPLIPFDFSSYAIPGGGSFNINVGTQTGLLNNFAGGNSIAGQVTTATASATVVYTYGVTTPEPASMALLGAGMLALGFARRRRG